MTPKARACRETFRWKQATFSKDQMSLEQAYDPHEWLSKLWSLFWVLNTAPSFLGTQKGTIILITTHIPYQDYTNTCYMVPTLGLFAQSARTNGPISHNGEYRQYRGQCFGLLEVQVEFAWASSDTSRLNSAQPRICFDTYVPWLFSGILFYCLRFWASIIQPFSPISICFLPRGHSTAWGTSQIVFLLSESAERYQVEERRLTQIPTWRLLCSIFLGSIF